MLAVNEFGFGTVALKLTPWGVVPKGEWTDQEARLTTEWLQRQGILVSVELAAQAVQTVARDRPFHPVKTYFQGLHWDAVERVDSWLSGYLGAEDNEYSRAVGARWLISAVARIFRPWVKADCCPILEGPQGSRNATNHEAERAVSDCRPTPCAQSTHLKSARTAGQRCAPVPQNRMVSSSGEKTCAKDSARAMREHRRAVLSFLRDVGRVSGR